ncbi:hypothetical protein F2Q68_00040744 [Brassica cretica]|uniref:Zinc finger GRF-type domain-containing protein n=1 Tax=Brassica cretica TaxID=69181 RepID=A0A8S9MD46_BRACR|nr:hypothetical protein F2Q68_00040744 [Brassica cretica]
MEFLETFGYIWSSREVIRVIFGRALPGATSRSDYMKLSEYLHSHCFEFPQNWFDNHYTTTFVLGALKTPNISSYNIAEPVQYPPQPEADDGIPTTCYCGGEPVVATSYTPKDPGRRYFTCDNVDDMDCHVRKWWDVAVMEEMSDFQTQLRQLKDQGNESEQKLVKLEKTVCLVVMFLPERASKA